LDYLKRHKTLLLAIIGIILLSISIFVDSLQSISPNTHRAKSIIESNLHKTETKAEKLIQSDELLAAADNYSNTRSILQQHRDNSFEIYIYKDNTLKYWSTNAIIPDNIKKIAERSIHFIKAGNGYYEVLHRESEDKKISIYALIPVYFQYSTNNKYLHNGFTWNHPFLKRFIISNREDNKTTAVNNKREEYLFSIRTKEYISALYNPYLLFIEIVGLLLLFWSFYQITRQLLLQRKYFYAASLIISIALITDILFNWQQLFSLTKASLLFSSNLYASAYL
jgi:hypothetical protein